MHIPASVYQDFTGRGGIVERLIPPQSYEGIIPHPYCAILCPIKGSIVGNALADRAKHLAQHQWRVTGDGINCA